METTSPLLNTLNGGAGAAAQFEMLWAMISFKVKTDMAQVQVLGSGPVTAHQSTFNVQRSALNVQPTLLTCHE